MTAGEINREIEKLGALSSKINDELIAAGRGHERSSETHKMSDPIALRWRAASDRRRALAIEKELRMGPGNHLILSMPREFGPRRKAE